ncbi:MAG: cation-translocating P-type ATPase [Acidovorax sp.]
MSPTPSSAAAPGGALLLDDPQEWPRFGRSVGEGRWESHAVLGGMFCAACALAIEAALKAVPGVQQAEVSAAAERARVVWDAGRTRPSQWMAAIEAAGYRAQPALDAAAREVRRREMRQWLWRWLVAGFCMMQVMMYAWPAYVAAPGDLSAEMERLLRWASWVLTLPVVLFACGPFFRGAWRDVRARRIGMDLPVALGMGIAFAVSTLHTFGAGAGGEVYFDSLTMFVFFLLSGRLLEQRLRHRNLGLLEQSRNRLPDSAQRVRADGALETVAVRQLRAGDVVRVLPGECFVADGTVLHGQSQVDEALLTGEATPIAKGPGDTVVAGSGNLGAPLDVRAERLGEQTVYAGMVALMREAATHKPQAARLADRVARPFLWGVLLCALAALLWHWNEDPARAWMAAVAVLIVTCPCALSLAAPVPLLTLAGSAARQGVLVRRLDALETLAGVDTVVFDKTGTLTSGTLRLGAVRLQQAGALELAALLARHSRHPAARALAALEPSADWRLAEVRECVGQGLQAVATRGDDRWELRLGSAAFAQQPDDGARLVLAARRQGARDWLPWASFDLEETLRPQAGQVVRALQAQGLQVWLLSGDREGAVQRLAAELGIAHARGACSSEAKLALLQQLQAQGRRVAMVGDGLNDGPVLAGADVSFALGSAVPLAQAQADVAVPGGDVRQVLHTWRQARRALRVVRQNLGWALAYNAVCIPLAVAGWMPAWLAGLGMALSSLLVVGNAARLARWPAMEPGREPGFEPNQPSAQAQEALAAMN